MDIRIDLISGKSETVVRIAGCLAGTAVTQLKKVCDPIEDSFVIDLSALLFADHDGINAIRAIADKGAQIHRVSPFIQLLLDSAPGWKNGGEESKSA
jgi:hypothetical protein